MKYLIIAVVFMFLLSCQKEETGLSGAYEIEYTADNFKGLDKTGYGTAVIYRHLFEDGSFVYEWDKKHDIEKSTIPTHNVVIQPVLSIDQTRIVGFDLCILEFFGIFYAMGPDDKVIVSFNF